MFEFGFSELAVVFAVALVVLGPTRLPGLVRNVGRWVGKARSMARQFRDQLESEVNVEELNRIARETVTGTPARDKDTLAESESPPVPATADDGTTPATAPAGSSMAQSGYPYGVSDPESPPVTDDTYSHAHAEGDAPMPYHPEPADLGPADPHVVAHGEPVHEPAAEPTEDKPAHS